MEIAVRAPHGHRAAGLTVDAVPRYLSDEPYCPEGGAIARSSVITGLLGSLPPAETGGVSVAIYGPWGVGKTSMLKQIEAACAPYAPTVYFEPWRYEKEEALILPLLAEMAAALSPPPRTKLERLEAAISRTGRETFDEVASRLLGRAARFALRVGAATLLGPGGPPVAESIEKFGSRVIGAYQAGESSSNDYPLSEVQAFREDFRRMVALGRERGGENAGDCPTGCRDRVFVFVDDLDRCAPNQIRRLLESLKTFLWEQNVCFVFALDRHQVELAIAETYLPFFESLDGSLYLALERSARYLDKFFPFQVDLSEAATRFDVEVVDAARQAYWDDLIAAFSEHRAVLDELEEFYRFTDRNLRRSKAAARWIHVDLMMDAGRSPVERKAAFAEFVFAQSYPRIWVELLQNCGLEERPGIYLTISIVANALVDPESEAGAKSVADVLNGLDGDGDEPIDIVPGEVINAAQTLAGTSVGIHLATLYARAANNRLRQMEVLALCAFEGADARSSAEL